MDEHPTGQKLRSSAHHWHLVGASLSAVHLDCCGCGRSMVVDATHEGGS